MIQKVKVFGPKSGLQFVLLLLFSSATSVRAVQFDATGHYGLKAALQTKPAAAENRGMHRGVQADFGLLVEARSTDQLSFYLDLKIFEDPRSEYLGDFAKQKEPIATGVEDSKGDHQNSLEPRYRSYVPKFTQAFARYAMPYCILEAGRRARHWGLGLFMNSGAGHYDYDQSIYDGLSCNINIENNQTLGVTFGYDKITETGRDPLPIVNQGVDPSLPTPVGKYGVTNVGDDVDQFFLALEYDDSHATIEGGLSKQVAVYAAKIQSASVAEGGTATEMSVVDFYSSLSWHSIEWKSEVIAAFGKSADPSYTLLGGAFHDEDSFAGRNRVNTLALAMDFAWDFFSSGNYLGPHRFRLGDYTRHQLVGSFAYAPGDKDGYLDNTTDPASALSIHNRSLKAEAFAFHENFKPALIMFNAGTYLDDLRVDGVFHPRRVMNATVIGGGYRYFSLINGEFSAKLLAANLNVPIPATIKSYYDQNPEMTRPMGTYGTDLGWELDLTYDYYFSPKMKISLAAAGHLPGVAWRTQEVVKPQANYLVQSGLEFFL
ncbi:MAG: hypothetical protein OXT67_05040 [Zetaproteobacteria bacterium]|nr:hypothetical protein [Zetaproteobacteria bacterium]